MELVSWLITGMLAALLLWILTRILPMIYRLNKTISAAKKLPCKPRHWLWGNTHQFRTMDELFSLSEDMTNQGHKAFVVWFFFLPAIYLCHPDTVKLLLRTTEPKSPVFVSVAKSLVGDGLVPSSGPKWERNRKLLMPAFHHSILKLYIKIYNQAVEVFMDKVDKLQGCMEIHCHLSLMTLDVIMRCALSYDEDIQVRGDQHRYVEAATSIAKKFFHRSSYVTNTRHTGTDLPTSELHIMLEKLGKQY